MIHFNEKQRAEVASLLEDYQKICDALYDAKRRFIITLSSETDDHGRAITILRKSRFLRKRPVPRLNPKRSGQRTN